MSKIMLEAHRGVATEFPENTLPAFKAAAEQGYDMIELDPDVTSDKRFVMLHDGTLNRTGRNPYGSKIAIDKLPISNVTLEEARGYDFGVWFNEKFRGTKIPTIEETVELATECNIRLKFDSKIIYNGDNFPRFIDTVKELDSKNLCGFTVGRPQDAAIVAERYNGAWIHYEGACDEESLKNVLKYADRNPVTVWIPYDNGWTSWCKREKANPRLCAEVKKYASLGLWLLSEKTELETARDIFAADIIETNGAIKPEHI